MISILIPAWNETKVLPATLNKLSKINYPIEQLEIIIIAGGEDGTFEMSKNLLSRQKFSNSKVIKQKNCGKNTALLQGLEIARGDIIVLLDADTLVTSSWLSNLVAPILSDHADATNGNAYPIHNTWVSRFFIIEKIKAYFIDKNFDLHGGSTIAIKSSILRKNELSFLNPEIFSTDDYHMDKVLRENGYRLNFVKNAEVFTYFPSSLYDFIDVQTRWSKGWIREQLFYFKRDQKIIYLLNILSRLCVAVSLILTPFFLTWNYTLSGVLLAIVCVYLFKSISRVVSVARYDRAKHHEKYIIAYVFLSLLFQILMFVAFIIIFLEKEKIHFKGPRPNS